MKVASFFAGIGGFDLGFEKQGYEVVFQCEINKFCQNVLQKHWPNIPLMGDINDVQPEDIPEADVWCGGFPCQDVSLANQGKRKGLKGERSGLFYKFSDLIRARRPSWVILENVPGLLNSHDGKDFRIVLRTLDELGYCVSWRVLDAKYFGTPQRRRRVYIVASYRNDGSTRIFFEPNSIELSDPSSRGKKQTIGSGTSVSNGNSNFYSIQHAGIGRKPSAGPQAKGYRNDGETYTLDSRGSSDAVCKTDAAFGIRDSSGISGGMDSNRFRALGNAVCVHVVEWIAKRIKEVS